MSEKQAEKIFKYIEGQFQNVDITCELETKHLDWNIKVTAVVWTEGPPIERFEITRRSEDLRGCTDHDIAIYINSLVHVLRHALCHYVFVNPEAPQELEL